MINPALIGQASQVPEIKVDLVTPFLKGKQLGVQQQEHELKAQESSMRMTQLQNELAKNARLESAVAGAIKPDGSVDMNVLQTELIKGDPKNAPITMERFSKMKEAGLKLAIQSSEAGLHAISLFKSGDTEGGLALWNQANPKMEATDIKVQGNKAIIVKKDGTEAPIDLSLLEKTAIGAKKLAEYALDLRKISAQGAESRKTEDLKQEHRKELTSGTKPIKHEDGTYTIGVVTKGGKVVDTGEETVAPGKTEGAFAKAFAEAQQKRSGSPAAKTVETKTTDYTKAAEEIKQFNPAPSDEAIKNWMKATEEQKSVWIENFKNTSK